MNREILFRGKRVDNGEWVYGYYLVKAEKHIIWSRGDIRSYQVTPETVGQFTGLKDKNGVKIFEGDKFDDDDGDYLVIEWINESSVFGASLYGYSISYGEGSQEVIDSKVSCVDRNMIGVDDLAEYEIIGNIYDNDKI